MWMPDVFNCEGADRSEYAVRPSPRVKLTPLRGLIQALGVSDSHAERRLRRSRVFRFRYKWDDRRGSKVEIRSCRSTTGQLRTPHIAPHCSRWSVLVGHERSIKHLTQLVRWDWTPGRVAASVAVDEASDPAAKNLRGADAVVFPRASGRELESSSTQTVLDQRGRALGGAAPGVRPAAGRDHPSDRVSRSIHARGMGPARRCIPGGTARLGLRRGQEYRHRVSLC